jgi:hypothetical protein
MHFKGFRPVRDGMNLARHFSAGTNENKQMSPIGTTDWKRPFSSNTALNMIKDMLGDEFIRPYGTPSIHSFIPGTEVPG